MSQPEQSAWRYALEPGLGVCPVNQEAEGSVEPAFYQPHDFARAGEAVRSV